MTKSAAIDQIAVALSNFQKSMKAIEKSSVNPFFKSKYADIATIINAIRTPLAEVGLSFSQFPTGEGSLTTILMHNSGQFIEDTFQMKPVDTKPQSIGSAITYMRRYALSAVLGIATEEDDDGNKASGKEATKSKGGSKPKSVIDMEQPPFGEGSED